MKIVLAITYDDEKHTIGLGGPLNNPILFYGMLGAALEQYMTNSEDIRKNKKEGKPPLVKPAVLVPKLNPMNKTSI